MDVDELARELREATEAMFDGSEPEPLNEEIAVVQSSVVSLAKAPPFLHAIYFGPRENARLNKALALKKALYEAELAEGKFGSILFSLVERPYRAEVLFALADQMSDEDYWSLLGHVWTDTESAYESIEIYKYMFSSDRPKRELLMDDDEREALAKLPERFRIYHGVDGSEFAWTLDERIARWFAHRFPIGEPILLSGWVRKSNVIAHFTGRNEEEIVVFPSNVEDVEVEVL